MVNIIGPYRNITKIKCDHDDDDDNPTPTPPDWEMMGICTLLSTEGGTFCCNTPNGGICKTSWGNMIYVSAASPQYWSRIFDSTTLGYPPGLPQSRVIKFDDPGEYRITVEALNEDTCSVGDDYPSVSPLQCSTSCDRFAVSTVAGQTPYDFQEFFQTVNKIPDGEDYYIWSDSTTGHFLAPLYQQYFSKEKRYQYGNTSHVITIKIYKWQ